MDEDSEISLDNVEITTRYCTNVVDMAAAWAFVMEHVDNVGPNPSIEISPVLFFQDGSTYKFEVMVEGTITQTRHKVDL